MQPRSTYTQAGEAMRQAHTQATTCGDLTGRDWRVLCAIFALVSSYSRTSDELTVAQIAGAAGIDERNTARCLSRLRDRGVITRADSRGRRPAATGLPPSQPWPHTAGVTENEQGPSTAMVGSQQGPPTAMVGEEQPWPESTSNHGRPRPPSLEDREESSAHERASTPAPAGSAVGRPAQPDQHENPAAAIANLDALHPTVRARIIRAMTAQRQLALRIDGAGDELAARAARDTRKPTPNIPEEYSSQAASG